MRAGKSHLINGLLCAKGLRGDPGPGRIGIGGKAGAGGQSPGLGQIAGVAQAIVERGEGIERLCLNAAGKHAHKDEYANTVQMPLHG